MFPISVLCIIYRFLLNPISVCCSFFCVMGLRFPIGSKLRTQRRINELRVIIDKWYLLYDWYSCKRERGRWSIRVSFRYAVVSLRYLADSWLTDLFLDIVLVVFSLSCPRITRAFIIIIIFLNNIKGVEERSKLSQIMCYALKSLKNSWTSSSSKITLNFFFLSKNFLGIFRHRWTHEILMNQKNK